MTAKTCNGNSNSNGNRKSKIKMRGFFPFGKLRVRMTAKTGNGKNNRRSFDCAVRNGANDFAQDDSFWFR
jgi:hypothetical protein